MYMEVAVPCIYVYAYIVVTFSGLLYSLMIRDAETGKMRLY